MSEPKAPTPEQIEALTSFLPRLYAEGFSPVASWNGGERGKDGSISLPYPTYHPLVEEFFRRVSSDGWLDPGYRPEQAAEMLKDESRVKTASLDQIRSMLTYCVRGERFSEGHWGQMIERGHIRRLLERLKALQGPGRP
jgi:hypothetical protein